VLTPRPPLRLGDAESGTTMPDFGSRDPGVDLRHTST